MPLHFLSLLTNTQPPLKDKVEIDQVGLRTAIVAKDDVGLQSLGLSFPDTGITSMWTMLFGAKCGTQGFTMHARPTLPTEIHL